MTKKRIYILIILLTSFLFSHRIFGQKKPKEKKAVQVHSLLVPENWATLKSDTLEVVGIEVEGNKRTKEWVILRELNYKAGSKIPSVKLDSLLKLESNKLFNTNLFITSVIQYEATDYKQITLKVKVLEKWYLYALPVLDVADRNFNEWWQDRNRDLSRLEYGFNFRKLNFRGRNETLRVDFRWGFNHKVKLGYNVPYVNKKKTLGLSTFFEYLTNHNIPYQTENNKLAFLDTESDVRKRIRWNITATSRKNFYATHSVRLGIDYEWIADSVRLLNPQYLSNNSQTLQFASLGYEFIYNFTDNQAYPLKGHFVRAKANKIGLGFYGDVDIWEVSAKYNKFTELTKNLYLANSISGQISTPTQQPYSLNKGLGYLQEFVRGYDLYVVDGQNYILNRNTLRFKILDRVWKLDKVVPIKQFNTMPIMILVKGFFDTAYTQNRGLSPESNTFQNQLLYGGGIGLDVFSFYNASIRVEYSINAEKEKGLFFYYNVSL